jgi:hypothetical protein
MQITFAHARNNKQHVRLDFDVDLIVGLIVASRVRQYICERGKHVLVSKILYCLFVSRADNTSYDSQAVFELGTFCTAASAPMETTTETIVVVLWDKVL